MFQSPQPGDVLRTEENVNPHKWLFKLTEHGELRFMKDNEDKCIYYSTDDPLDDPRIGLTDINEIAYASSTIARVLFMQGRIDLSKETLDYILFMEEQSLNNMKHRLEVQTTDVKNFELKVSMMMPSRGTSKGFRAYYFKKHELRVLKEDLHVMHTQVELFEKEFNEFQTKVYSEVK